MIRLKPIVGVEQRDRIVPLRCREDTADRARRPTVIGMSSVKSNMSDPLVVDPLLRKAVSDNNVIAGNRLTANALDASFQNSLFLFVVWRHDNIFFLLGKR